MKIVLNVFPCDLRITSKETAVRFYKCIKSGILIPINYRRDYLRVEPDNCISVVSKVDVVNGNAWMIPSIQDLDGTIAYRYRKVINAYLRGE